jgi:hypothetical protein
MLKMFPSSLKAVGIQVEHIIYSMEFLPRNQTLIFFFMKREFVNKSWIFCTPLVAVLRMHLSP